ncbi:nicotinate-nucleotide--dimethylbenzimidazole phosphoribosyltransferase [Patulibacter brassicae]|uniref:Nicotinate-nucleotide--dimethylbenzimidazole phosphoribosyltransferase n=1 Tax=Patulibacter brassicae TaxID=1705717 RepID=A0ABU4VPN7_9ACTN|nr:nicotinate-nucleotide--dimethylbenzimidazole phosphoribosyltransferase [Patulibacter brassicae]MDX8153599.1 nicotinate-nucleotide--dimethylbenzimidazole phosphoribosyltransferase [Patulibacter brassicae]
MSDGTTPPPSDAYVRPETPEGFDPSRAAERAADPAGWRFPEDARAALYEIVDARRDIRRFRPDPVPADVLGRVLTAAHHGPSVGLMQPWRFLVVRDHETRVAMRGLAQRERLRQAERFSDRARHFLDQKVEGIVDAPLGIVVCCDPGQPDVEVLGRGSIRETDVHSTACAIQNLWLAARAEGLGVGWVSFYRREDLRTLLGIPDRVDPLAWLCVGWPDERPVRPGLEAAGWAARAPLSAVVADERWPAEDLPPIGGARGDRGGETFGVVPTDARRHPEGGRGTEPGRAAEPGRQAETGRATATDDVPASGVATEAGRAIATGRGPGDGDDADAVAGRPGPPPPGPRIAAPSDDPVPSSVRALLDAVGQSDERAATAVRDRADRLVKPLGSLGALEAVVERWAAWSGDVPPSPLRPAIPVFAADHGHHRRGTSLYGAHVTAQVAAAAARGGTAIGVLAQHHAGLLSVVDVGLVGDTPAGVRPERVAAGTADLVAGPAMDEAQLESAILVGARTTNALLDRGARCVVPGEIGIGNTTAAAALACVLAGVTPELAVGRGAGADAAAIERKREVVRTALERSGSPSTPLRALRELGGLELAAVVGAILAAAGRRVPVVLDGFAVGVAALAAVRLRPAIRDALVAGHRSAEPAHGAVLAQLGLEPLLDLRLRLGEASGAALALPLIEQAGRLHRDMETFAEAGVDGPGPEETPPR